MLASALLVSSCMTERKASPAPENESPAAVETVAPKPAKRHISTRHTPLVKEPRHSETGLPSLFVPRMPGKRIAQVNVPGPYVALTFDDGPHPANTPKILDILKRHNAKATFFVVGESAARHKAILARAVAEGNEVGAHTWSHIKMSGSSDERIISEMDRTNAAITDATGRRPVVMRPPYGATNSHVLDLMMSRYGMSSILWNVDTEDWKHPGVDVVTNRAVSRARNGSIILVHDIHASTLAAVEGIVTGLQRRGFHLVTVSELIEMGRNAAHDAGLAAAPADPVAPAAAPVAEAPVAAEPAPAAPTAVMVSPTAEPAAPAEPAPQEIAPLEAAAQETASPFETI